MAKFKQINVNNVITIYPHLTKPDGAFGNDANPKYHTKFKLDGERAERLCAAIDEEMRKCAEQRDGKINARSNVPYVREDDGSVTFKATVSKFGAFGKAAQWENVVVIVDAKLQPCTKPVYGGSEVNLRVELYTYVLNGVVGLQMRPKAVQVLKLAEQAQGEMTPEQAAAAAGFTATDGFTDDSPAQGFNKQAGSDDGDDFDSGDF